MSKKKDKPLVDLSEKVVDQIFEERYGSGSWKNLLASMPHRVSDLKDFVEVELEILEVKRLIKKVREDEGSFAANLGVSDAGKACISPLQNLLSKKRATRKTMLVSLKDILDNVSGDDDDRMAALDGDDDEYED